MILRIMLSASHRSFARLSQDILSRLLVIDLQAGNFRNLGDEIPTRSGAGWGTKKDRPEKRLSWFCRHLVPSTGQSETRVPEARTSSRWPHFRAAHQQSRYVLQSYQFWTMGARVTCSPHNCWFAESSHPVHWMTAVHLCSTVLLVGIDQSSGDCTNCASTNGTQVACLTIRLDACI